MLRLLGAVLIIGAGSALGMSAKQKLSRHIAAIASMIDALDYVTAELSYQQTPLPDIISQLADGQDRIAAKLFGEIRNRMQQKGGLSLSFHWQSSVRDLSSELGLDQQDTEALTQCAVYLGRYQLEQQLVGLKHTRAKLERAQMEACEQFRKQGNLYRTCGLALGIMTVLVLL